MKNILELFRVNHWIKNFFIFTSLIFAKKINDSYSIILCVKAFIIFCFVSSSIYILNDIFDKEYDKIHPEKSSRPIASNKITVKNAYSLILVLSFLWAYLAILLNYRFFLVCLIYFILNILYSWKFKHIVILDIMIIAAGFVLRILAGSVILNVKASSWVLVCTTSIALFIAVCKRRHEILILNENSSSHRKVLEHYNLDFIDQLISVTTASTILSYTLYTVSSITIKKFNTEDLIYSVPFVIFGVFRYLYIVYLKKMGGNPTKIVVSDIPMILNLILWLISVIIIIY